ncbi:MAG: lipocalin-like domain-containing protein [Candidatus Eremiobacteraeota bacterium]|nr:lipocalin-like domain-containing protein [Candidatus Eremiobacteraeota bacterium]
MNRATIIALIGILVLGPSLPARAADASALVGTWQISGFSVVDLNTNETSRPFGEHPIGYLQYSPGGHVLVFLTSGEQVRPSGTVAYTDAERAAIHKSIFGAYSGTYRVDGNAVTHHVISSWRPEWVGTDVVRYFEIDGKKLTLKTAPAISAAGQRIVATLTFERIE